MASILCHGSFATTGQGHGTDKALAAGLLDLSPDDPRLPYAFELAQEAGMEVAIGNIDLPGAHPNTAVLRLTGSRGGGRVIQNRINDSGLVEADPDTYWSTGLSAARIQAALNKWKVDCLPGDLYRFMDVDDPDLKLILDSFEVDIPHKLFRKAELKHIKTGIKVFI